MRVGAISSCDQNKTCKQCRLERLNILPSSFPDRWQVGPIVLTINQVYWTAVRNSSLSKLVKLFESMEDIDGEVEVDGKVNEKFEYFAVAYNSENAASI